MNLRFRLITAAAFAVLFFLIPSPDNAAGRAYLGTLKVREWLLASDGPLAALQVDGAIPPLAVEYRLSPPDPAVSEAQAAEVRRTAAEWAAARRHPRCPYVNNKGPQGALPKDKHNMYLLNAPGRW